VVDADGQAFGWMCLGGRYRGQARSHRGFAVFLQVVYDAEQCGSWLACDGLTAVYQSGSHPFNTNRIIVNAAAS
jgi:hypothetical protein